ncbi:DNA polymerase subunit gamma-1, mitochondrial [Colletes gigas]|uniref:DNA polymerase subunit gamma-1, mitochondrial n=1 Tax=Colletes gigas TaxID=935657 RepID=UPI001C9ABBF2|nr:DNA polymerase subunit gamma-1, mitochondrial [Colletes gigas]
MKSFVIRIPGRHKRFVATYNPNFVERKQFSRKIVRTVNCNLFHCTSRALTSAESANKLNEDQQNNGNNAFKTMASASIVLSNEHAVHENRRSSPDIPVNFEEMFSGKVYHLKDGNKKDNAITEHQSIKRLENEKEHTKTYNNNNTRVNEINMQMLSKSLHKQIFNDSNKQGEISKEEIESIKDNLRLYGIKIEDATRVPDVDIRLPPLEGNDIEQHFYNIAKSQIEPYVTIVKEIMKNVPKMPDKWILKEGWTRYTCNGAESVDYPLEDGIIFDIEVCMKEGSLPTLATAVTSQAWYGWVSKSLVDGVSRNFEGQQFTMDQLIPMESKPTEYGEKLSNYHKKPKILVGHNVSFDRSRIKEQYWLNQTGLRFVDTLSLHISVSGISSYQRAILNAKRNTAEKFDLHTQTSLNSLTEIYKFYCGTKLNKELRNVFVEGTLKDVKKDFETLMTYCANDVLATYNVLCHLFPIFEDRFPHPVTLAGMLELGTSYLPTNSNWLRYLSESETTFEHLNYENKCTLAKRANAVCELMHNEKYKEDLWMWDEDWSTQKIKMKSTSKVSKKKCQVQNTEKKETDSQKYLSDGEEEEDPLETKFAYLKETRKLLPIKLPHMSGYPAWYRKLCFKFNDKNWEPGPQNISTSMQIVPKLLNLTWEGYPLHYMQKKGWGILVPYNKDLSIETKVPLKQLLNHCSSLQMNKMDGTIESDGTDYAMSTLNKEVENDRKRFWNSKKKKSDSHFVNTYKISAVWCNTVIDNCCYFLKLPHKDGENYNVGNPLAKDFLNKFSENVLAGLDSSAAEVLRTTKMMSYWRNNRNRIMSQFVIWFDNCNLPNTVKKTKKPMRYGAILPLVVVSGTLTRRAVEPTWMTASNANPERVGSELRAMIQAPPGYSIIGADVDSQELWISSMIGDAYDKKIHGATPFGWMTLIGTKSNETDMHSITAKAIGISRSQAKVINYARIYGAGQNFAERLLKQFNPCMTDSEAASKSRKMFTMTKGKKVYRLKPDYTNNDLEDKQYSSYEAHKVSGLFGKTISEMFETSKWVGGSESAMFNRLEEIAQSPHPVTPFLNSRLTRALENQKDNSKHLPTKINWVVQSGAVDFLHLMLVSMKWLMKDNLRFCLSFHDEVRYLVPSRYKYNAALAMHVTNLLTRSFCASRVGIKDLPMSVAFFTSVEVDTVLRKESRDDCKTPSNVYGLTNGYEIPPGESLDIFTAIEKTGGSLGSWHAGKKQRKESPKQETLHKLKT